MLAPGRVAALLGDFSRSPAFRGLADGLRTLIAEGRVPVGARLPSERDLTRALGVSRTTVTRAYDLLREERYLTSRQGSGSVTRLPVSLVGRTDHLLGVADAPDGDRIDLTIATPMPPPGLLAAYERAAARFGSYAAGTGYYPTGVPALLEALAERYSARGLPTTPDQLVVVGGALAGLAAVAQVLVRPGDRALVELPTYPNPITTLRARSARLVTTPVDPEHGWDVDHALGAARGARLAYLVPDFHNPTGALMGTADRIRLGDGLTRLGVVPVVDESLVDTALDDDPLPLPFATFAPETVTVGSASKSFWGGLRIGWVRAPRERVAAVRSARLSLDLASAPFEQLVLLELMADEAALRAERRTSLGASRAAARQAIADLLPDWQLHPARGGLSLWCRLPMPRSTALAVAAE
ncbi:MAG: PLP-dependent aminotransferase family protein, partial [Nocardioidaceae bacterium]|nr:PLP-dependent aminotransferase family protein [Nocardioidaceae bacterium]